MSESQVPEADASEVTKLAILAFRSAIGPVLRGDLLPIVRAMGALVWSTDVSGHLQWKMVPSKYGSAS